MEVVLARHQQNLIAFRAELVVLLRGVDTVDLRLHLCPSLRRIEQKHVRAKVGSPAMDLGMEREGGQQKRREQYLTEHRRKLTVFRVRVANRCNLRARTYSREHIPRDVYRCGA